MHPLDLFDRARRAVFRLLPFRTAWERTAQEVAPDRHEDWLLEPLSREEACCLYPHLEPDEAVFAGSYALCGPSDAPLLNASRNVSYYSHIVHARRRDSS